MLFKFLFNTIARSIMVLIVAMLSVNFIPDHLFQDFQFEPKAREPVDFDSVVPQWNNHLKAEEFIQLNNLLGPESLAFSNDGLLYTGLADGRIVELDPSKKYKMRNVLRFNQNSKCKDNVATMATDCGRFLQLRFVNNTLYGMEANTGLYKIDVKRGTKTHLGPKLNDKVKLFNSFAFDPSETNLVYITVSSTRWSLLNIIWVLMEAESTGKLVALDVTSGKHATISSDLFMANGVDVDITRDQLIFSETLAAKISSVKLPAIRQAFKRAKNGDRLSDVPKRALLPILPGLPDNIVIHGDIAYIALPFVKSSGKELADHLMTMPNVRKALSRFTYAAGKLLEYVHENVFAHPSLEVAYRELKSGHLFYRIMQTDKAAVLQHNLATGSTQFLGCDTFGFISEAIVGPSGHLYLGSFRSSFIVKVKKF